MERSGIERGHPAGLKRFISALAAKKPGPAAKKALRRRADQIEPIIPKLLTMI